MVVVVVVVGGGGGLGLGAINILMEIWLSWIEVDILLFVTFCFASFLILLVLYLIALQCVLA